MEYKRLTTKDENGDIIVNCQECQYHELFCMICTDYHCINALKTRVAELEDKIEQGVLASIEDMLKNGELVSKEWHDEQVMHAENELQEYQNRIENGTLVELPCKVGDTIYIVGDKIEEFTVTAISIDITKYRDWGAGCIQFADKNGHRKFDYNVYFSWIGKSVFFDKAEAEKKLEELRNENK